MFLFCLVLYFIINTKEVTKVDILGLLDEYEDWCNTSVDKIQECIDEKNKTYEERQDKDGIAPTEEENKEVNDWIEQVSVLTNIKNDLLVLKQKVDKEVSSELDL